MTQQQKPSTALHITLWVAQLLLAATLIWTATMKLLQPPELLAAMWPWAGQIPASAVKATGITDLLAAMGLTLPAFLRIKPMLTPVAAIGIIVLMIAAATFHIARGEASVIGVNIVFAAIAAFIAWGRLMKAPVPSR